MNPRQAVNIFFFVNGVIIATIASRLLRIQDLYGLNDKQLGFLLLTMSIGAFIGMPITGWLIHKYKSHTVTGLTGWLLPIAFILIPWMPVWGLLFIPFFIVGVTNGIMDVGMNAQAVEVEKIWQRSIMTFFHALFSVGMLVGAGIGNLCVSYDVEPFDHFLGVGIFAVVLLSMTSAYLLKDESTSQEDEVLFALPKGALIGLGFIAFCCMLGEGAMADWSSIYMERIVEASKSLQVAGLIAFTGMMALARFVGDTGRERYGDKKMMVLGAITSLIGIVLIITLLHPWLVILGFGLVGLGLANIVPIVYSLAGNFPGIAPGVGIAMATTIGYMGFMVGPPLIGFISDAVDLQFALSILSGLFLVMAILVFLYRVDKTD